MTSVDLSVLTEQIDQYAAELRRTRTERLGREPLTWLALLPQWTGPLAAHCRFPTPEEPSSWIEDAVAAGVCQRQTLPDDEDDGFDPDRGDWPQVRFWMPEIERGEVLGGIRGRTALRRLAADIGARIRTAPADIERDPGLDRWADLAVRAPQDARIDDWLTDTVSAAVDAGRMPEALNWVYAAEALGPALGEDMISAAARAKRLINLEYRRRLDARFVKNYLRRDRQREAVKRLLATRDKPWALHFVGMGGVGKTMLIRYLSGGFAADGGENIVTTRVDFDHISPRYPVEEPGQLLRELAGGLAGHLVKGDQVSAYQHFTKCADVLDRLTANSPGRGGIGSPEFEAALDSFATLVMTIEQRVVLILDTCEELAKLYPAGGPVPSIEHTFKILERLHGKAGDIRVIFAGRRLLAAEYSNWRLPAGAQRQEWAVSLAKRDYVELFEIRGFKEEEARGFISTVRGGVHPVPRDIENAILQVAPDTGRVAALAAAPLPDTGVSETEPLYNPFELALYADWYDESAGALTATQIKSGDLDTYVKGRIVRRLPNDPPVAKALPAVAILGRADLYIVRTVLAMPEAIGDRVFRALSEQEWIGTRAAEESGVTVLEVQSTVLRRLRAYFGRPERVQVLDTTVQMLGQELPRLLERRPLDAAAVEHVAALMRILPSAAALSSWDELVIRIRRDGEWAWAESACARLLAEDASAETRRPVLDAAVRAVFIGAVRRRDPAYDAAQDWTFVAAMTGAYPDDARCSALADRAALGIATDDARHRGRFARLEEGGTFTGAWSRAVTTSGDDQRLAAALATAEAFLDAGADEPSGTLLPVDDVRKLADRAAELKDPLLTAFAQVVLARTELRAGLGTSGFQQAERLVQDGSSGTPPVDWPLPPSARARILLLWLHATVGAPRSAPSPDMLPRWLNEACGRGDIEHERLASALLLRLLADGPVDSGQVRALDGMVRRLPPLTPLCPAHSEMPPLAASVVRAWVALGEPDAALALIEAWEESSPTVERDAATTAQVRLATVYLVRRMRWSGLRDSLVLMLAASGSPEEMLAARAAQVLLGTTMDEGIGQESPQAADIRWRTASALNAQDASVIFRVIVPHLGDMGADPVVAAHLALDRQEAERLSRRTGIPVSIPTANTDVSDAESAIERRLQTGAGSSEVAMDLRAIRLRRWTLAGDAGQWPEPEKAPHDWAEAALEEGELLSLRGPAAGKRLLDLAARLFEQAGDLPGATISSIRSAIASYHDGDTDGARKTLNQLKPWYDRLRALSGSDLPAWDSLIEWTRERPKDAAVGGAWDGWLTRLAGCIAQCAGQRLEPSEPTAELNLSPAPRYRGPATRLRRFVITASATVSALWSVFVIVGGGAAGGRAILGALGWHPYPLVGWVLGLLGLAVAFVVVIALLVGLTSPVMKLIGAQFRLVAAVEPVTSANGPPHRADVSVRVVSKHTGLGIFAWYFGAYISFRPPLLRFLFMDLSNAASQRRTAAELPLHPDPLRTSLPPRLAKALDRAQYIRIEELALPISSKTAPDAWEAVLSLNQVTASDGGIARDFRIFRAYAARARRPAQDRPLEVAVLCARPFALLAEASWEAGDITPQLFHGEDLRNLRQRAGTDVLHLIGTPVPDEFGPMLALEGSTAQMLQPDRLPLSYAKVIIVQAEPTRSSVSADQRTVLIRTIAHDIAVASAGAAVIAIPVLPSHLAKELTEEIARTLAGGQTSRRDLLALVHRLRDMVFRAGDPADAVAARAVPAFDICLYMGV
jgi:hypothetical protein